MAETEEKKNKEAAAAEETSAEKAAEGKTEEKKKDDKPKFPPPPDKVEGFVHLHVHTEYSLLDGAARLVSGKKSPLLDAVWNKGMRAMAITDHGNMFAAYTFQKKAKDHGIKSIIGCEFYTCADMNVHDRERNHLLLIAKNNEGYYNLVKLNSLAYTQGFHYKPRIDLKLLKEHSKGLICLSACLAGKIPQLLLADDYEAAKQYAIMLRDMFDEGDFYIELQDHGIEEQKRINPKLVQLAKEIGVKVVATNDAHYIERSDAEMHEVLLCIQTGKTLDDPSRMRFETDQFYIKTPEEMEKLFAWVPEAITSTAEIANKCNVKITRQDLMPPFRPEDGSTPPEYLRKLAYEGLEKRYGVITDEIRERAEYELGIIIKTGFAEYYLIVWDFIHYAKSQGIPVGAGRGSGVSSIIAYAIGITNVDPLKYQLLFERFLNPERVSAPDFDVDFCYERRGEVIDYVIRKYGSEKVCQILALGTMKAKGAIKDVARVYGVPLALVNRTTKAIDNAPDVTLEKVLYAEKNVGKDGEEVKSHYSPEVVDIYNTSDEMHRVIDMALKIEGMPRQCSKHAAGVVICKEVISDYVPLQKNGDDITTQYQKDEVEELGMLKMDFLGLKTLTDVRKAHQYVMEDYGVDVDFSKLGYEDPKVYELISTGETDAVFQLEGAGMKKFMRQLRPENMEDIIAGISLYRPGPMDKIPEYVQNKHNPDKIKYAHPLLEPILSNSYGIMVYQEQVMQIVQSLAGFSLGRADLLRRAMGKKKVDIMKAEKAVFLYGCPEVPPTYNKDGSIDKKGQPAVDGCEKRGVPIPVAEDVFADMQKFASYAFNKSHAAAYAVLAYETAYYKCYYPIEFIAAVINNRITSADEVEKYLTYLRKYNYEIFPPNINKSFAEFKVENGGLRFGLCGVKGVGMAAMQALVEEREKNGPYKTFNEIFKRLPAGTLNKKLVESLIKAGAFDCFGYNRSALWGVYDTVMAKWQQIKKNEGTNQMSLFDMYDDGSDIEDEMPRTKEYGRMQKLIYEKEVLGIYMSGHPLEDYTEKFKELDFNLSMIQPLLRSEASEEEQEESGEELDDEVREMIRTYDGQRVVVGGMLHNISTKVTKSNELMATGRLEDMYGDIEVVAFPKSFAANRDNFQNDKIVLIEGVLNAGVGNTSINVRKVTPWALDGSGGEEAEEEADDLYINVRDEGRMAEVNRALAERPGRSRVFMQINGKLFRSQYSVTIKPGLIYELEYMFGEKSTLVRKRKK
mgnify:FL=1